jgi:hypothetical protein
MAGKTSRTSAKVARKTTDRRGAAKVALLSGGNPQIAKGEGDAPVQAYIAAMPGWKRDIGRSLDALIVRTVPGVRKAIKWNSPLYGIEGDGWFLGIHCLTKYVKVAFFHGASLRPLPPGASKQKDVRYLDIHEGDELDEAQLAAWVKQASRLPRRTHVSGEMKKATSVKKSVSTEAKAGASASQHIDARIKELGDWRGETLARVRALIKQAVPDVVEEWKWRGVPVWEHGGIICTGETYKSVVKLTFAKGASLEDPSRLFNSSLEGNTRRAIDLHEGDKIDEKALKVLVRAAAALNASKRPAAKRPKRA